MKIRTDEDFKMHAWEMARQHGAPGDVAVCLKAIKFGYELALRDSVAELKQANDRIAEFKKRSNTPR